MSRAGCRRAALECRTGSHGAGPDGARGPIGVPLRSISAKFIICGNINNLFVGENQVNSAHRDGI